MSYLLSERHFRRNEDYLAAVITSYPAIIVFDVRAPITQADVLARNIRYAGRSLMASQWKTTTIDFSKFIQVWDDITISPTVNPGKVTCGPDVALRDLAMKTGVRSLIGNLSIDDGDGGDNGPSQVVPKINLSTNDLELIHAVIVFHHHRYLTEPSIITSAHDIRNMVGKYDVAVQQGENGSTYTII